MTTLAAIAEHIGHVESALRGIVVLGMAVKAYDPDSPAYLFACVVEPLAQHLADAYCALADVSINARDHTDASASTGGKGR